jgi:ATP-dependent Clp protease adaptor protein ClpS
VGQASGEDLEDAVPLGGAVGQGGRDHRELVPVGEQRGSRQHDREAYADAVGPAPYGGPVAGPLAPERTPDTTVDEEHDLDRPWVTIVWNDPVNLMNYVTFVLQELFGYDEPTATTLMLQVHHEGKAIVSSGPRERMEHDTSRLHAYGLWASYQRDS